MVVDRRALAALGLVLLLVVARLYLGDFAAFSAAQDLSYFDESQYLNAGTKAAVSELSPQWAPPYCLWYRALFRLTGDAIVTYHLNAYVLAIALPTLWYLLCIAIGLAPWWSLATALGWLVSNANLETLRVGNFAACIVLGGLIVSRLAKGPATAWWLALAALWVAASVRLELMPAAVVAIFAGAWLLHREWRSWPKTATWFIAALIPHLALDLMFGWPFGAGRSGAAFQQHLAGNILEWHNLPFEHWIHYEDVIRQYYALPSSALDFALHEPIAFAHHVATNAWRLVSQSIGHTLMPATSFLLIAPLAVAIVGGPIAKLRTARQPYAMTPTSIALSACAAMVIVSCLVIYPRDHYLPLLLTALLLIAAPRPGQGGTPITALAIILLVAVVVSMPTYPQAKSGKPRPEQETVEALRALQLDKLTLFDDSGVLQVYVPAQRLGPRDFRAPFDQFVRDRGINAIVLSPKLPKDPLLREDPTWQQFLSQPESLGFECQPVGNTERSLCLRH